MSTEFELLFITVPPPRSGNIVDFLTDLHGVVEAVAVYTDIDVVALIRRNDGSAEGTISKIENLGSPIFAVGVEGDGRDHAPGGETHPADAGLAVHASRIAGDAVESVGQGRVLQIGGRIGKSMPDTGQVPSVFAGISGTVYLIPRHPRARPLRDLPVRFEPHSR